MIRFHVFLRFAAALAAAGWAWPSAAEHRVIVGPSVGVLAGLAQDPPGFLPAGLVSPEGFRGSLRFLGELEGEQVALLESAGVKFVRDGAGGVAHLGALYPAWVSWDALDLLVAWPWVVQVEADSLRAPVVPLNVTKPLTGAVELAQQLALTGATHPGQGVKVGDMDSGIDPYHPAFFLPDGGYFAWLDVNGDGAFAPDADAVDLDGDGSAAPAETLRMIDVALVNLTDVEAWTGFHGDGKLELDVDWLYADTNGNGERDYGAAGGYDDAAPGFGEPLLVVDDVDRDGELDRDEKLVLLKTSKIAAVLVAGKEYLRGQNLTEIKPGMFGYDENNLPGNAHGTGVAGIMAANTPGFSRFVGLAPYIDIVLADNQVQQGGNDWADTSELKKLIWCRDQGVDILLHEYSGWGLTFMDGSSNIEKALDELYQKNGILQVAPAGNLAGSGKHMKADLAPGESSVGIDLPEELPEYEGYPFVTPALILSAYWYGADGALSMAIQLPGSGSKVPVPLDQYEPMPVGKNVVALAQGQESYSGLHMGMLFLYDEAEKALPAGKYVWHLTNKTGDKLAVQGYLMDYASSWSRVVIFDKWETDETTICHPSTADSAISVGAYAGEFGMTEGLGNLRGYSGRGPRMDGDRALDIAAPDDPYTPFPQWDTNIMMGDIHIFGSYMVFGGTSGAGPHVAAGLALLLQTYPDDTPGETIARLYAGCAGEPDMGTLPNPEWGFGKLNVYKSVFGSLPDANLPPVAAAWASAKGLSVTFDASPSVDGEGGEVSAYRWDFDYDGEFDTGWLDEPLIEMSYPMAGHVAAKLMVRDAMGATGQKLIPLDLDEHYVPPEPSPDSEDATGGSDAVEPVVDDGPGGGCGVGTGAGSAMGVLGLLLSLLAVRRWGRAVGR